MLPKEKSKEKLSVIGSGLMGHSIALTAAWAGYELKIWGNSKEDIERGKTGVLEKLSTLVRHGVIRAEEQMDIVSRIEFSLSVEETIQGATFIIEAIPENLPLKQEWFERLDRECPPDTILASNTSGLSPTRIAERTQHSFRTVVTHFWNPAHLIPLVEIVRGEQTSDETVQRALELLRSMQKKPIVVKKDALGSVGNRLQYALFREAQYILEQGIASMEDIDAAVKYSIGRRLPITGPFVTADMGGLDVFDAISNYLFPDLSTAQESLDTMKSLVQSGQYGQKNGSGFYQWTPEFSQRMNEAREKELIDWLKKDFERE